MPEPSQEPATLKSAASQAHTCLKSETTLMLEKYFRRIVSASQKLSFISRCFQGIHTIPPLHCHTAIDSLEEVGGLVQELCEVLRPTLSASRPSSAPHYALVCMLHSIKERAGDLSGLIKSYIPSYKQPHSPFASRQRHYITLSFEILLQHIADFCLETGQPWEEEPMLDESMPSAAILSLAHYREKRAHLES